MEAMRSICIPDVLKAGPVEFADGLCDLSVICSTESKCFAASVGMAGV